MAPGAQEVAWVVVEMGGGELANGRPLYLGTALQSTLAEWGRVHAKLQAGYGDGSSSLPFRGRNGDDERRRIRVLTAPEGLATALPLGIGNGQRWFSRTSRGVQQPARLRGCACATTRRAQPMAAADSEGDDLAQTGPVCRELRDVRALQGFGLEQHHHQHLTAHQRGRRPAVEWVARRLPLCAASTPVQH